jgi:hypothetical protein
MLNTKHRLKSVVPQVFTFDPWISLLGPFWELSEALPVAIFKGKEHERQHYPAFLSQNFITRLR